MKHNRSQTKFYQVPDVIVRIIRERLKYDGIILNISILNGGLKNAVYLIETTIENFVLKIAPQDESKMLTYERNTIEWEAKVLKTLENYDIPSPRLLYFDNSYEICKSPYILMTYIEGNNLDQLKSMLTTDELNDIEFELGKICQALCSIKGDRLFLPGFSDKKFVDNYELVVTFYNSLICDAHDIGVEINYFNPSKFLSLLGYFKQEINNISNICYAHYDLWDGNILIQNGKISGIVDFADMYIADELMTFYFHDIHQNISSNFLKGFGKINLSHDEIVRVSIYKILVLLKMTIEKKHKNLAELSSYEWIDTKIIDEIEKLNNIKNNKVKRYK